MEQLLMNLIGGAIGGNGAGMALKKHSLGPLLNTVVGVLGGGIGGKALGALGMLQSAGMLGDIGGSAVGGGALMMIVSVIKKAMAK